MKAVGIGLRGVEGVIVDVEVGATDGLPGLDITGLPSASIREARHRVRTALRALRFQWPKSRLVVNLGPADFPKSGTGYDLPLAVAVMAQAGQLPHEALHDAAFWGELSLQGALRAAPGVINVALAARNAGIKRLYVPRKAAPMAAAVDGLNVFGVESLGELSDMMHGERTLTPHAPIELDASAGQSTSSERVVDMSEVRGQTVAKRALEIAASGGHNLLMVGPPGCGKTLLARALVGILPEMSMEERLDVTQLHALRRGEPHARLVSQRPFRAPHASSTLVSLVGGGTPVVPGEVSLAHHGVLFLDETPEFSRRALESLRTPIEDGHVTISRATETLTFPCELTLVCAMNPCPCGYQGDKTRNCRCTPLQVQRYRRRISGPMLDRIGMRLRLVPLPAAAVWGQVSHEGETSVEVRARVNASRERQRERAYRDDVASLNAKLRPDELVRACRLSKATLSAVEQAAQRLRLSARGLHRVLRISRTVADQHGAVDVEQQHLHEALNYRALEDD